jgi:hypothetical protein
VGQREREHGEKEIGAPIELGGGMVSIVDSMWKIE